MGTKNRKFNVAGASFYNASYRTGTLVYFRPEPENPNDRFAIQVLNKNNETIGYIPKGNAEEIISFMQGKYKHYCAKIVEIWKGRDLDVRVPQVLAHFATTPKELPFAELDWR